MNPTSACLWALQLVTPPMRPLLQRHSCFAQWVTDSNTSLLMILCCSCITPWPSRSCCTFSDPHPASPAQPSQITTLRSLVGDITNTYVDDSAWIQASLPVCAGGLSIRSAVQLAPSAFLSSAAASLDLVHHILPPRFGSRVCHIWMQLWSYGQRINLHLHLLVTYPITRRLGIRVKWLLYLRMTQMHSPEPALLAVSTKESGARLNALPITSLGLRMDDNTVRVAVSLRLGTTLCHSHVCHRCGEEVNHLGTHGLSCVQSEGRYHRHAAVNDILHLALCAAHVPSWVEPSRICHTDRKRPDGVTVVECGITFQPASYFGHSSTGKCIQALNLVHMEGRPV